MEYPVDAVDSTPRPASCRAADISALRAIAQAAINVELFTIPLYMGAMYSIQGMHQITGKGQDFYRGRLWPGPATTAKPNSANEKAFNTMFSVFIEEMLHLQLAANIASSLGRTPSFTSPLLQNSDHSWNCYGPDKTFIPHIIDLRDTKNLSDAKVNIEALSHHQLRLFRAIEQPEADAVANIKESARGKYFPRVPFEGWKTGMTERDLPMFGTIGYMYQCYFNYLKLSYQDDPSKCLWDYVYDRSALQRDLFNAVNPPGHPMREFLGFDTTITPSKADPLDAPKTMMSAITDQGEGNELPAHLLAVQEKYQASEEALKADYPRYTDTGQLTDSADAAARFGNGARDHYERFTELEGLLSKGDVLTWPNWRPQQKRPWTAKDLQTQGQPPDNYGLPSPETIAKAMNDLGSDSTMYSTISKAAVGSIAGITTVLDDYWANEGVLFPYPSMAGSGDRMAICWALFRKAPDLSAPQGTRREGLQHACQGLDFGNGKDAVNDCAAVEIFHSCRGSNDCKTQGGCGFVQQTSGGGGCGFALVNARTDDSASENEVYSAPSDNKCASLGGCAVPISASQIMPRGGTMQLFDFDKDNIPEDIGTMPFARGEKVYDVAYRAYGKVMEHRKKPVPPKPEPNNIRLAFPPST